jgi:N-acetyl-alpha-D-muramate 1-phosphate uridylyltransferase
MKAMVLAAGRGERMRPLTDTVPKPLLRVGGRSLISWHLEALARAGFREVVVNLSWLGEQLRAALGDGSRFGVSIRYSDEGPVALETGGGILRALPLLGPGPFLVVSGDVWTDIDFARVHLEPGALAHLVLVANPPHHPRGDFGLDAGYVVSRDSEPLTYANVGIYTADFFAGFADGRFPLIQPLTRAIGAGLVRGELHRGQWCDVGTPQRLAELDLRLRGVQ